MLRKQRKIYTRAAFGITLFLQVLLFGFLGIWVLYGSDANIMSQVGLQRARVERMTKDVLVLTYRTSPTEKAQATSELQDILPLWKQTQLGLQIGDESLGLPKHPSINVVLLLAQAQTDYVPLQVALQQINAHPTHVDLVQLQIILTHESLYYTTMTQVNTAWEQHIDEVFFQLFWIETVLVGLTIAVVILHYILARGQQTPKLVTSEIAQT